MSNIDYISINENFPTAGVDNSTEGFRKNFNVIRNSLKEAKSEIESLDANTAKLNADNDFGGNDISNANLLLPTTSTYNGGIINAARQIDFQDGFYQTFTLSSDVTLAFGDFPLSEKYSVIRLALKGENKTVSFSSVTASNIYYDSSFPAEFILDSLTSPYIIEVWYQESSGFHLKFLGKFDTTRFGTGTGGGLSIPIATRTILGAVRIGTGLNIQPNGLLSGFSGDYNDLLNKPDLEDLAGGSLVTIENIVEKSNEVSGDIPNDTTLDSIETTATRIAASGASSSLLLTDASKINHYRVGQKIRVFGASITDTKLSALGTITATKNGFTGGSIGTATLRYKVALFNLSTGSVGASSGEATVTGIKTTDFNLSNNIALTIEREDSNQGVLIYRQKDTSTYDLIAVLGSKDLGTSLSLQYVDYFAFDKTLWSRKRTDVAGNDNTYFASTGTKHFPLTAPSTAKYGWYTSVIESINVNSVTLTLADDLFFESSVDIVHDDTDRIQEVINLKAANGTKSLKLGNKTYFVSKLLLPSNFSLMGSGKSSTLKKLHWSSTTVTTNRMIQSTDGEAVSNVKLEGFSIDGNMQNQYLINDTQDLLINYAVDIRGTNITFDNLSITNTIGGGIASSEPNRLFVTNCEITNSGLSDRYPAGPIVADNGTAIVIANNMCRNFSEGLDASLTNIGIISGNIVDNCGSGIIIFGSTKLVSSPNLILGPAGEFIPGPDLFNSEYDAVNIVLENNTTFVSDVYVYQENGELFDLTANRASLAYKVDKLRKVDNVEELYGEILISGVTPLADFTGLDKTEGQFKFAINAANVTALKTTYSYSTLKAADPNHIGLVYRALLTEWFPVASVDQNIHPFYESVGGEFLYQVTLTTVNNLNVGARVRFLGHGGSLGPVPPGEPSTLDSAIGEIVSINLQTKICVIKYLYPVNAVGSGGQLTRENTFVLAKGKIQ